MRERVTVAGTIEAGLLSSASVVSGQIATATAELHQARDTILMQNRESVKTAQLITSIRRMEDNVAFYEASEEGQYAALRRRRWRVRYLGSYLTVRVRRWLTYGKSLLKKCHGQTDHPKFVRNALAVP